MSMTLVSTVTVGAGGASTIEFTSIPETATDLLVVISARSSSASSDAFAFKVNSSATGYADKNLRGNGSAASSVNSGVSTYFWTGYVIPGTGYTASTFGNAQLYIPNYTSSTRKSLSFDGVGENNNSEAWQQLSAGSWSGTAAITSIQIGSESNGTFAQYSTASLYLITKGSGGATVS
jgi:hypothetical protein